MEKTNHCANTKVWKKPDRTHQLQVVSLTPCAEKLLEIIIKSRIDNHLEANKLLKTTQNGFRKGREIQ